MIHDGEIVFEYYAPGHGSGALTQYFSVTKSTLATLVGIALHEGLISSLDQPVTDFVPELAPRDFSKVTICELLDMTTPLDYTENDNPFGLHVLMNYTSELEPLILGFRLRDGGMEFPGFSGHLVGDLDVPLQTRPD